MNKSINITIRISPELKQKAEEACAYMDMTLSDVMRKALRDIITHHHKTRAQETYFERMFMEGDLAERAIQALKRETDHTEQQSPRKETVTRPPLNALIAGREVKPKPKTQESTQQLRDLKFTEDGRIDPSTMSRKLRRAYQRDFKGTTTSKPLSRMQENILSGFDPEERLRELLQKEKRTHLTRLERDQKNALIKAGVKV